MKTKIIGETIQSVEATLSAGEIVKAEAGSFVFMDEGVEINTTMDGGFMGMAKRFLTGESIFIPKFHNKTNDNKKVVFAAPYPGNVVEINLGEVGGEFFCQKDSFLFAEDSVDVSVALTKRIGAGLFGGEGFILQKLGGSGIGYIHIGGTLIEKELANGEKLIVDTGCLAGFTKDVDYDIKFIGGFKNVLFGGEGLFFATLTGPGKVYIQSLPFSRIADRILASATSSETKRGGNILGNILGGD